MADSRYKSILVIVAGFLILYLITDKEWLVYLALGLNIGALIHGKILDNILRLWFGIGKVLGFINSRILLSAIYYLILFPLSLLSRLSSGDKLMLKRRKRSSYFIERDHVYGAADLEKPW